MQKRADGEGRLGAGPLGADLVFQIGNVWCEDFPEVGGLEHRADLDIAIGGHRICTTLNQFNGVGHILDLPQPETGDQLAALCKRPVEGHASIFR